MSDQRRRQAQQSEASWNQVENVVFFPKSDVILSLYPLPWFSAYAHKTRDVHQRLDQCWPNVYDAGPTLNQPRVNVRCFSAYGGAAGTGWEWPRSVQCWPNVCDAGLTLNQPRVNVRCFSAYGGAAGTGWEPGVSSHHVTLTCIINRPLFLLSP